MRTVDTQTLVPTEEIPRGAIKLSHITSKRETIYPNQGASTVTYGNQRSNKCSWHQPETWQQTWDVGKAAQPVPHHTLHERSYINPFHLRKETEMCIFTPMQSQRGWSLQLQALLLSLPQVLHLISKMSGKCKCHRCTGFCSRHFRQMTFLLSVVLDQWAVFAWWGFKAPPTA